MNETSSLQSAFLKKHRQHHHLVHDAVVAGIVPADKRPSLATGTAVQNGRHTSSCFGGND